MHLQLSADPAAGPNVLFRVVTFAYFCKLLMCNDTKLWTCFHAVDAKLCKMREGHRHGSLSWSYLLAVAWLRFYKLPHEWHSFASRPCEGSIKRTPVLSMISQASKNDHDYHGMVCQDI